jgi:hypothetical protein
MKISRGVFLKTLQILVFNLCKFLRNVDEYLAVDKVRFCIRRARFFNQLKPSAQVQISRHSSPYALSTSICVSVCEMAGQTKKGIWSSHSGCILRLLSSEIWNHVVWYTFLLGLLDPWRWDRYVVPKRRYWTSWPWRWDQYVVPKRRYWTSWPLKMGPIRCPETSVFLDILTLEDGTDTLSRNVGILWLLDPWRWDRYVVPKRRYWTSWPLKMGPILCPETSAFLDFLTLEDGTDTLSRNVGKGLALDAAI